MKPYKVAEENETHITYEYRTAYTWIMYAALFAMVTGMVVPNELLTIAAGALIALYLVAKLALGHDVNAKIRQAMQANTVQLSGSKTSFSNPLRIKVPK